jgi:hypothetical protein
MKTLKPILASALCFFLINSFAQHQNVEVSSQYYPNEPSICVNPFNTEEIFIGANGNNFYKSTDGGYSWESSIPFSPNQIAGDPCILVDKDENIFYIHLTTMPGNKVLCQRKRKTTSTWSSGTTASNTNKDNDKEWAVIDQQNDIIYTSWTEFSTWGTTNPNDSSIIMISKSEDKGNTWSTPHRLSNDKGDGSGGNSSMHASMPAVGPNGEVYVTWMSPQGILFEKSNDFGETWQDRNTIISDLPSGWLSHNTPGIQVTPGFPVMDCDTSHTSTRGNIYINWCDMRDGNLDSWVVKSIDGGSTWSLPIKVNNDGTTRDQFFTWMKIDPVTGFVYFVFYDRRNYNNSNTDVYMAVSKDGCETFENFKISEEPFIPYSSVFFGHYNGISAYNNVVRPSWTRMDDGVLSLWTAIIDLDATDVKQIEEIPFELSQNSPNPFRESTFFSFKIKKEGNISLIVYDVFGKKVSSIINNEFYNQGKYIKNFENNDRLKPGIYFFVLEGNGIHKTSKMIVQ